MQVASFVLSVVAVLIAGSSALFTWRNHKINQERRIEERAPEFHCEVERLNAWYRLTIRAEAPFALSSCRVRILDPNVTFTPSQEGVAGDDLSIADYGQLPDGAAESRRVELKARAGQIRLRIECSAGRTGSWVIHSDAKLPPPAPWVARA
jgi:hypothetical protein